MEKIEIIHQEKEIQFANFTNDFLNQNEMQIINGGQSIFCKTKKTCEEFTGSCTRISCGLWKENA